MTSGQLEHQADDKPRIFTVKCGEMWRGKPSKPVRTQCNARSKAELVRVALQHGGGVDAPVQMWSSILASTTHVRTPPFLAVRSPRY